MSSNAVANQLVKSLSFEVVATPQENVMRVTNAGNKTPLNVKIRVRKKDDANSVVRQGVIAIPKADQADSSPERVRLASSDQTIMSFNVWIEADIESKPRRKAKRNLFGLCLGTHSEDDDSQYRPTSTDPNVCSRSDSGMLKNKALSNINDTHSSYTTRKKDKRFFGKCKPGGCLDPPFGEEKYAYQPKPSRLYAPALKILELDNFEKESLPDKTTIDITNVKINKENPSSSSAKVTTKKDNVNSSILSLYQGKPNKMLEENESDSLITYPPTLSSSGLICEEENNEKNVRRSSAQKQHRNSFNEFNSTYYNPPKTAKESTIANLMGNIPKVTVKNDVQGGDAMDENVDKRKSLQSTSKDDILLQSLLSNEYKNFTDHENPFKDKQNSNEIKQRRSIVNLKALPKPSKEKLSLQDCSKTPILTLSPLNPVTENPSIGQTLTHSIGQTLTHSRQSVTKSKPESATEGLLSKGSIKDIDAVSSYDQKSRIIESIPIKNPSIKSTKSEKMCVQSRSTSKDILTSKSTRKSSANTSEFENKLKSNNQQSLHSLLSVKESISASDNKTNLVVSSELEKEIKLIEKTQSRLSDNELMTSDQKTSQLIPSIKEPISMSVAEIISIGSSKLKNNKTSQSGSRARKSMPIISTTDDQPLFTSKQDDEIIPNDQKSFNSTPSAKASTSMSLTEGVSKLSSNAIHKIIPNNRDSFHSRTSTSVEPKPLYITDQQSTDTNNKSLHSEPSENLVTKTSAEEVQGDTIEPKSFIAEIGNGMVNERLENTSSYNIMISEVQSSNAKKSASATLQPVIERKWLENAEEANIPRPSVINIERDDVAPITNLNDLDKTDDIKRKSPSSFFKNNSMQLTKSEFEKQIEYEINIHPLADTDDFPLIDNVTFDITITNTETSPKDSPIEHKSSARSPITEIDIPKRESDIIKKAGQRLDQLAKLQKNTVGELYSGLKYGSSIQTDAKSLGTEVLSENSSKYRKKLESTKSPPPKDPLSADVQMFDLPKTRSVQVKDREQGIQPKDTIFFDLAFQTYLEETQMVLKSLDSAKVGNDTKNVILVKRFQDKEINIPIDSDRNMNIRITPNVPTKADANIKIPKSIAKFDSGIDYSSISAISLGLGSNIHSTISSVYDHELLPLQQVITHLKEDIQELATRQLTLREALGPKRLRSIKTTHNFSTKKCVCSRK